MKKFLLLLNALASFACCAESNWDGNYYQNHSTMQYGIASIALNHIQIPVQAQMLDIGCGDGRISDYLSSLVPSGHVTGIDLSASMIAAATQKARANLSFFQMDAAKLEFREQFDRVVSFNCLHWVEDIQAALKGIHHALVPGGQALLLVAPVQARHPIHQIIDSTAKKDLWQVYFNDAPSIFTLYTFADWASLIEKSGMIPEKLLFIDASFDYASEKEFADWLAGWVPFGSIPEGKKDDFINDIVQAYTSAIPCEPNGMVHFYLDELVIVASKPLN